MVPFICEEELLILAVADKRTDLNESLGIVMILMISHFLSLISVCAYGCDYLFKRHSKDFLEYGGDKEWLERGYEVLPLKL